MSTDVDDSSTTSIPRGGVLSPQYFWISFGMSALVFLAAFESMAVTTIMPVVSRDLDGRALYALAFAGPLAIGVLGMVIAGNWSDREGPRAPLIATVVAFALGLLIAGTATDMWMLVAGRLVQGVGAGGMLVPLYVLVARVYPPVLRPRIFAGFAAAWVVPSLVGPFLAGLVTDLLSWHWVFLGVIGLVAVATLMVVPALRHPGVTGNGRVDAAGAVQDAAGAVQKDAPVDAPIRSHPDPQLPQSALAGANEGHFAASDRLGSRENDADPLVATSRGELVSASATRTPPKPPWSVARIGCAVLVAAAVLGLNLSADVPQPWPWLLAIAALAIAGCAVRPLLPKGTLSAKRGLPTVMLVRGLLGGAFLATEVYIPYLLTGPYYGLTPAVAGIALTGAALAWSSASWVQGRFANVSHVRFFSVGGILVVIGICVAIATSVLILPPFMIFVSWVFAGGGMGLLYPRLSVAMLEMSPESEQGFNSSALSIADSTGAATQIALTALVFAALLPRGGTWAITGCFVLTAAIAAFGASLAGRAKDEAAAA